jgi:hypothetical protein
MENIRLIGASYISMTENGQYTVALYRFWDMYRRQVASEHVKKYKRNPLAVHFFKTEGKHFFVSFKTSFKRGIEISCFLSLKFYDPIAGGERHLCRAEEEGDVPVLPAVQHPLLTLPARPSTYKERVVKLTETIG